MLDHMMLTVSDVERSLVFYKAALKPLISNSSCRTRAKTVILTCGDLVTARRRSSGSSKESPIQQLFTGGSSQLPFRQ